MTVEPQDRLEDKRRKNWFWDYNDIFDVPLSAQAKLVRLYLARCADQENRQAWPSLSTIAKHCGISRTTVKKAITELLETGWLDKRTRRTERGDYATTVYILCHPAEKDKLTENLPSLEGGRLTQSLPCHEMTGGGSPHDPPCHEMTGVGRYTPYVGRQATPNNNHGTITMEQDISNLSVSSLRSDTERSAVGNQSCQKTKTDLLRQLNHIAVTETNLPGTEQATLEEGSDSDGGSDDGKNSSNETGSKDSGTPSPPSSGAPPSSPTNRDIIAALGDAFLNIPGMADRYPPGPQRQRVYALMGRLYNQYDCEPIFRAVESLEKRPAVQDPLRYVAGVAKKIAARVEDARASGRPTPQEQRRLREELARQRYEAIRQSGEENPATPEAREWLNSWRAAQRQAGDEYFRRREELRREEQRLLKLLDEHRGDEFAKALINARLKGIRHELHLPERIGGFVHVGACLDAIQIGS